MYGFGLPRLDDRHVATWSECAGHAYKIFTELCLATNLLVGARRPCMNWVYVMVRLFTPSPRQGLQFLAVL